VDTREADPMNARRAVVLLAMLGTVACGERGKAPASGGEQAVSPGAAAPAPREGMLAVPGGEIWYRVMGDGSATPLILLHGGPGFSSYYLKPLDALASDRTVVRYDQLGGGKSTSISDTTMFTIPHFVAELDSLRSSLGYDRVDILGHSWGTILALEYYRAHPEHVVSMVLASAVFDIPAYEEHARSLVATLSDSAQAAIRTAEESGDYASPAYQAAMNEFYGRYLYRHPIQADLDSTFATANEGIYNYMQGPSEFTITGTLKSYDAMGFLPQVKVPVLYTVGEFDEVGPDLVRHFQELTPGSELVVIPGAAHITTWDNPDVMIGAVQTFLDKVDQGQGG